MTAIGTQPAARITPLNTTASVVITETLYPTVRLDDAANKIHGDYATIYLKEKPLQSAGVTITGSWTAVNLGTAPDATHFTVDYKEGILFFLPAETAAKVITYTGTGAPVDAEKLLNNDYVPPNVVHVLPDAAEAEGKIYKTYATAIAWITNPTSNPNFPTVTNTWTIRLHGTVTEAIEKVDYVAIVGDGISTRLLGMVTTDSVQTDDITEITDCYIEQFAFDSGIIPIP